jgi:hypothetical protein
MSQQTARHDPHAQSGDEDVTGSQARRPEHEKVVRPSQPVGQPASGGGVNPDEPDEDDEFELIGDNDLGAADLGPAAPNAPDPDAGSVRVRKITRRGRD